MKCIMEADTSQPLRMKSYTMAMRAITSEVGLREFRGDVNDQDGILRAGIIEPILLLSKGESDLIKPRRWSYLTTTRITWLYATRAKTLDRLAVRVYYVTITLVQKVRHEI